MTKGILVVFTNPTTEADEDEFNRWYTERHAPDIINLGGAVTARRYHATGVPLLPGIPEPGRYLAIYEIDAETIDDVQKIAAVLQEGLERAEIDMSPTLDMASIQAAFLLPIGDVIYG